MTSFSGKGSKVVLSSFAFTMIFNGNSHWKMSIENVGIQTWKVWFCMFKESRLALIHFWILHCCSQEKLRSFMIRTNTSTFRICLRVMEAGVTQKTIHFVKQCWKLTRNNKEKSSRLPTTFKNMNFLLKDKEGWINSFFLPVKHH